MEIRMEKVVRPKPLPEIAPHYDMDTSVKPETIRVSFEDGSTEVYERRIEQPAPLIRESIRIIRKWKTGYQYQEPKRRRRGRR